MDRLFCKQRADFSRSLRHVVWLGTLVGALGLLSACQTATVAKTKSTSLSASTPTSAATPATKVGDASAVQLKIVSADDASAAQNFVVKNDQPLRAFTVMEKIVEKQKFMSMFASQFSAFLGRDALTRELANAGWHPRPLDSTIAVSNFVAADAMEEIAAAAKSYRVVILDESHNSQQERVFGHLLAQALRANGYTHMGYEALSPGTAKDVNKNGPSLVTAFYAADPVYADFVRQAKVMGYEIFDYEPKQERTLDQATQRREREAGQAANIKKVFDTNQKIPQM